MVWAGPVVGSLLPLVVWLVARLVRLPGIFVLRFFVGFCLVANGIYIGVGSFNGVGDAGDMIRSGSEMWHLWAFGIMTAPVGLMLWSGLGPEFGLAKAKGDVGIPATYFTLGLLVALVAIELACFTGQ